MKKHLFCESAIHLYQIILLVTMDHIHPLRCYMALIPADWFDTYPSSLSFMPNAVFVSS